MLKYVHLDSCRSKCICDYLNDIQDNKCSHCDNCTTPINLHINSCDYNILNEFFANYFIYEQRPNCIAVSSGYYKLDGIGELIKNSKYRNWGYFDNQLLERVLRAYHKYYKAKNFDAILFVPPTKSGDLVENFAQRIADRTNIPLKTDLIKIKEQEMPLKSANNKSQKEQLVKGIFKLNNPQNYINKKILLIDDIIDSGATIDEIAYLLKQHKVSETCVLTIAKTNVGDE
jgi:ATP-dependent DNA helicase RecQ